MHIEKKRVVVGAVVAGLIAGAGAAMAMGKAPDRDAVKTESSDTHGCGGPNGCGGKNGCPGK